MSNFDLKQFLDFEGLQAYDELIKAYIQNLNSAGSDILNDRIDAAEDRIGANEIAIATLNGDEETEGSVAKQVNDAIAALVDGAPEALDTLKEIADWIGDDETGTEALISRVSMNETNIAELQDDMASQKEYIDAQDLAVYNSIQAITPDTISVLFRKEVELDGDIATTIANLKEDEVLVMTGTEKVTDAIEVPANAYIQANGAEFSGNVTVDPSAVIEGAVFTGKVTIA